MKTRHWIVAASITDLLFLYLPIAILIVFSFNASKFSARWQGFSLQWYAKLFTHEALLSSTWNSLIVAVVSTILAGMLGVLTAVALERQAFPGLHACEGVLLLPIIIPEIMMGVAMLLFFVMIGVKLSLVTIIIAHTMFNFPVVALIVRARLRKLDPQLEEAALDLGATPMVVDGLDGAAVGLEIVADDSAAAGVVLGGGAEQATISAVAIPIGPRMTRS